LKVEIKEKNIKMSWRIWYERIKLSKELWWVKEELTLCVLKKLNWELAIMMLTNMEIRSNEDVVKVFSKYSSRWWVEDTYKYMKQESWLEKIMLRKYKSLQNMMIFVLWAMNFVSILRRNEDKYFCKALIDISEILNLKKLKYKEHSIVAWIRNILRLSSTWIRDFLRNKIQRITWWLNLCLFDKFDNPFKILGKL
jgi:hypothetical protein